MLFHDRAILDTTTKRVVSMRDGWLEYLGSEIGREPADQTFHVYRPPSALANASRMMDGLPIVDGHVDPEGPPPETDSYLLDTQVIEHQNDTTGATLATSHHAQVGDELRAAIDTGRRETSLGYTADLVDTEYRIEQINITPHHLAAETEGRCGPACSFLDHRKPLNDEEDSSMFFGKDKKGGEKPQVFFDKQGTPKIQLPQGFIDQEGSVTMQQAVEIASGIPEAIKTMPLDQLQQYMETLKEIYEAAKKNDPNAAQDEDNMDEEEEKYDDEGNPMNDKAKSKAYDALKDKKAQGGYTDAQVEKMVNDKVAQATKQAVQDHAKAIEKARHFLDDNYDFTSKDTQQIMRDAIATQTSESYTDQELPLAFKMLQIPERQEVVNFGDRSPELGEDFQKLADKSL